MRKAPLNMLSPDTSLAFMLTLIGVLLWNRMEGWLAVWQCAERMVGLFGRIAGGCGLEEVLGGRGKGKARTEIGVEEKERRWSERDVRYLSHVLRCFGCRDRCRTIGFRFVLADANRRWLGCCKNQVGFR